ncbi:hypothetical protein BDY19DRAFT_737431 [Irpex rosettiformis]|uniref:Uncharacterized protein n=1 Tax=Irpex rosettiformis TaxID=378272 RepID=A0ACB8U9B7_9APHY|nr:hypothetical protein BDY19DRAFT_737431 [Irpex rosettiformis]
MSCNPTPTKTQFAIVASTSTLTTVTDSVLSRPPIATTIHTRACSSMVLGPGTTTCVELDVTEVSTIPGGQTTLQMPIVIVFQITQASPTKTLFASCSGTKEYQSVISAQTPLLTSPPPSMSSISLITTTVTPAPSVIASEYTTTLLDGSVEVDTTFSTSTFAPIPVVITANPTTPSPQSTSTSSAPSTPSIAGPIVGGILGGFFGLIGIVFLIWWLWKKQKVFLPASLASEKPSSSNHHPRLPPGYMVEPQQYEYGNVGSAASHRSHNSSPPSLYARSSQSHSHSHGHSIGYGGTHPSFAGASSQWLDSRHNSSPTPPMFASTAIIPGTSADPSSANLHSSSGSSFPGYIFQNPPPSSFPGRAVALSGFTSGTDDEQSSDGHGSIAFVTRQHPSKTSRRHSRSPVVERRSSRPQSSERRTVSSLERMCPPPESRKSFSGVMEVERPARPPILRRQSTDAAPVYEEPRSPLFVVNHTEEPSESEPEPEDDTPSPP